MRREELSRRATAATLPVFYDGGRPSGDDGDGDDEPDADRGELVPCPECEAVCVVPALLVKAARNQGRARPEVSDDEAVEAAFHANYSIDAVEVQAPDEQAGAFGNLLAEYEAYHHDGSGRPVQRPPEMDQHCGARAGEHGGPGVLPRIGVCLGRIPARCVPPPEFVASALSRFPQTDSAHPCDVAVPAVWMEAEYSGSDIAGVERPGAGMQAALVRRVIRCAWPSGTAPVVDHLMARDVDILEVDMFLRVSTLSGYRGTALPWAATECICGTSEFDFAAIGTQGNVPAYVAGVFATRWDTVGVSPAEALLVIAMAKSVDLAQDVLAVLTAAQEAAPRGFIPARAVEGKLVGLLCAHMRIFRQFPLHHRHKRARRAEQ